MKPRYFFHYVKPGSNGDSLGEVFVEDINYSPQGIREVFFGSKKTAESEYGPLESLDDSKFKEHVLWLMVG